MALKGLIEPRANDFIPPPGLVRSPGSVQALILTADVPKSFTVPSGAAAVFITADANLFMAFFTAALDGDIVTDGDFPSATNWTLGTGWSVGSGTASSDASQVSDSDIEQAASAVEGQAYWTTFTTTGRGAGDLAAVLGGTEGTARNSNDTYTEGIIAGSDGKALLRASSTWDGNADDFSAVPCALVPAADVTTADLAPELILAVHPRLYGIKDIATISVMSAGTPTVTAAFYNYRA